MVQRVLNGWASKTDMKWNVTKSFLVRSLDDREVQIQLHEISIPSVKVTKYLRFMLDSNGLDAAIQDWESTKEIECHGDKGNLYTIYFDCSGN